MPNPARVAGKLGRKPEDHTKPRLRLSPHLRATAPPPSADFYSHVGAWGVEGNDQYGDCVFAGNAHIIEQQTALGDGTEVAITTAQALAEYTRVTGFNPDNPSTDNGAEIQDGLGDLRKNGLGGQQIAAFARADHTSVTELKTALAELGCLDLGVNLPQSAMDQFNAGQPWDVVADDGGILGGHCIVAFGYDTQYIYIVTWGKVVPVTWAWLREYCDEAWAVVSAMWAGSKDPAGVDLASLGAEFATLTGDPSPFPAPSPTPPSPGPSPDPDLLAEVAELFHEIAVKVTTWLHKHGVS